jgi:hypothetical protein
MRVPKDNPYGSQWRWFLNEVVKHELAAFNLKNRPGKNKKVLLYPEYPSTRAVLRKILLVLGYEITNNPRDTYEFAISWEDTTYRTPSPELLALSRKMPVLNFHCNDISKEYVEKVFRSVFGYGTFVDPLTHQGKCVRKGNANATHDGSVIQCPVTTVDEGFIYQIVINNQIDATQVEDIRVPVFWGNVPFVYVKHRPLDGRFLSRNNHVVMRKPEEILSREELDGIAAFCKKMQLDYGELDVLRCRDTKRIYIVDVNNTPGGPANGLSWTDQIRAMHRLAKGFAENFPKFNPQQDKSKAMPVSPLA